MKLRNLQEKSKNIYQSSSTYLHICGHVIVGTEVALCSLFMSYFSTKSRKFMWSHILNFFWINGWSYKTTTYFYSRELQSTQISYASLKIWSWKICSYHNIFYIFSKAVILVPILKGFWPKLLKNGSQSRSSNRMKVSFFPFIVLCRENSWEIHATSQYSRVWNRRMYLME